MLCSWSIDDEPALLNLMRGLLAADYDFHAAESAEQAQEIFDQHEIEIVVSDQQLRACRGSPSWNG